jgi:plastocyanin
LSSIGTIEEFRLMRNPYFLVPLLFAGLAAAGPAGAGEALAATPPAAVEIHNFNFTPPVLTITAGTTVVWTNQDDSPHTLLAADKSFRSAALDTGDKFSYTFATPGDYHYLCGIHPMMKGEIIVKPAGH